MDLLETMRTRRSVRAFKNEPITREVVELVLSDACQAPSAINMQPWEVNIVMGEERERLSRKLKKTYRERQITCGPGVTQKPIPEKFIERSRQCVADMTPLIERMGSEFKTYINEGSLDFYGAPAVVLMFLDESFPLERMIDVGAFMAYFVLAAAGHGLATCPIGLVTAYQDEIKDHLNINESKNLVISVALGNPDSGAHINDFRSTRAELKEFVRWVN